jgi:hypothetical protein
MCLSVLLRFLHGLHFGGQQVLLAFLHVDTRPVAPVVLARYGDDQWLICVLHCLSVRSNGGTCVGIEPRDFLVNRRGLIFVGVIGVTELVRPPRQ